VIRFIQVNQSINSALQWALFSLVVLTATTALFFIDVNAYEVFAKEDGVAENLSFVFYAASGLIILMAAYKNSYQQVRGILPVLLGLFFIVVAGEEISWGQRLFGFDTPESMAEGNTQGEFNFHNLSVIDKNDSFLNQHTLLNVFVLLNGVVFPVLYYFFLEFRSLVSHFKFPIIPIACAPVFFIALIFGQTVSKAYPHWAHVEVKELCYALGFLLFAISFYRGVNTLSDKAGG